MKKKLFYLLLVFCMFYTSLFAQKITSFEIKDGDFYRNGERIAIISGEMHYARIPHQYWRHRLRMMKAMGLNTVATYVFWNLHEPEPGKWDFAGDKNLAEYIRIAAEENMMVILRPGPYVCAEWEFGGYPWWLQTISGMEIRRDNAIFLKYTKLYLEQLYKEVGQLQVSKNGPIIMVQCENEFGSYVEQRTDIPQTEHQSYYQKIKKQLEEVGFDIPMFTSDGSWNFDKGSIEDVLPTANGETNISTIKEKVNQYHNGKGPYMVAEFYPGWLSHWNEEFPNYDPKQIADQTDTYLKNGISINFYMVHGGTNFGFTSGANYNNEIDIQPDLTSYDYDAPISEAGWITPKYTAIRNIIRNYVESIPEPPAAIPVIDIPSIKLTKVADVLGYIKKQVAVQSNKPSTFEDLRQAYGYVLYSRKFNQARKGKLSVPGLRDYAIVYVDGKKIGELNRSTNTYSLDINVPFNSTLDILVENMGRINYGGEIVHNTKGIIAPVTIDEETIDGYWKMYKLPMSEVPDFSVISKNVHDNIPELTTKLINRPLIYEGIFNLTTVGDTFINMENWGKGIIFINGVNIGRYWKVGPQQTLYIPGVWLKKGENKIYIFEQLNNEIKTEVSTIKTPILDKLEQ